MGNFLSDQNTWIGWAGKWSLLRDTYKLSAAIRAAEEANYILQSAPQDVGGEIYLNHTVGEAEDLYAQYQALHGFANGIHYEADELIDCPFTQRLEPVIQSLYNLNPKDFHTEPTFLGIFGGKSLEDLLLSTVDTRELKKSYKSMIEALDKDKISDSLTETIETANYWAVQYEKAAEIRQIASEYLNQYSDKWATLSEDEKLAVLKDYGMEISEVLDEKRWYDFILPGNQKAFVDVNWNIYDPQYDSTDSTYTDSYAYTRSLNKDGLVYINYEGNENSDEYDLIFMLETVTHETRHQNQGQSYKDPKRYNLPEYLHNEWSFDASNYGDYWTLPWEIDARAFAALTQFAAE